MYQYSELAYGLNDRGHIFTTSEISTKIGSSIDRDVYINTLRFDISFKTYVENQKTVAGYHGQAFMAFFPIDIDHSDLRESQQTTIDLCTMLSDNGVPVEVLRYYYSGNKGFHILIPNQLIGSKPSESISDYMKKFAGYLLDTIDYDSTIYNHVRLFRLKNSKHQVSGRYKIPLTYQEIMMSSTDDIIELSQQPRDLKLPLVPNHTNPFLHELWKNSLVHTKKVYDIPVSEESNEYMFLCSKKMMSTGATEGNRNNTAFRVAWMIKKTGANSSIALESVREWNKLNKPPLDDKELEAIVSQVYKGSYHFGCSDPILQLYCDDSCPILKKRHQTQEDKGFKSIGQIGDDYTRFLDVYKDKKMGFGHPQLDQYLRGLLPKFVVYIVARAGVGKTSFCLDSIQRIVGHWNEPTIFFSLEMSREMVFERFISRYLQVPYEMIPQLASEPEFKNHLARMEEEFRNLVVYDASDLSIESMAQYVEFVENRVLGKKVRIVFIDYMGLIKQDGVSEYAQTSARAVGLQKWAKQAGITIVCLVQTSREGGKDGQQEIALSSGRGSGAIEETADIMLGMWRNVIDDKEQILLKIIKNRYGLSSKYYMCGVDFERHVWNLQELPRIG